MRLAQEFVKAQLLTPFQAMSILNAKWRGLRIGDYSILQGLSHGGMGEIYVARDATSETRRAIKALKVGLRGNQRSAGRFCLEALTLAKLNHPNVIRYINHGWVTEALCPFPFLVTEFVQAPNLFELMAIRRRLPWRQACDITMQAALGLHHAHRRGFVHQDMKPGNLLVSVLGVVKVIDFGLAHYLGSDQTIHQRFGFLKSSRVGTMRYSAPEQLDSVARIAPSADVYALGATLLYALTGKALPADLPNDPGLAAVKILRSVRSDVPHAVEQILRCTLARSPRNRLQSAGQVAQRLEPLSARFPVEVNFDTLLKAREKARRDSKTCSPTISLAESEAAASEILGQNSTQSMARAYVDTTYQTPRSMAVATASTGKMPLFGRDG